MKFLWGSHARHKGNTQTMAYKFWHYSGDGSVRKDRRAAERDHLEAVTVHLKWNSRALGQAVVSFPQRQWKWRFYCHTYVKGKLKRFDDWIRKENRPVRVQSWALGERGAIRETRRGKRGGHITGSELARPRRSKLGSFLHFLGDSVLPKRPHITPGQPLCALSLPILFLLQSTCNYQTQSRFLYYGFYCLAACPIGHVLLEGQPSFVLLHIWTG